MATSVHSSEVLEGFYESFFRRINSIRRDPNMEQDTVEDFIGRTCDKLMNSSVKMLKEYSETETHLAFMEKLVGDEKLVSDNMIDYMDKLRTKLSKILIEKQKYDKTLFMIKDICDALSINFFEDL